MFVLKSWNLKRVFGGIKMVPIEPKSFKTMEKDESDRRVGGWGEK